MQTNLDFRSSATPLPRGLLLGHIFFDPLIDVFDGQPSWRGRRGSRSDRSAEEEVSGRRETSGEKRTLLHTG